MKSLRTKDAHLAYQTYLKNKPADLPCEICTREALTSFTYWKIIRNDFPYDRIAEVHHMLTPIRHVTEKDLTQEERAELLYIKDGHLGEYKYILEGTPETKTIPEHLHFHVIVLKDFQD